MPRLPTSAAGWLSTCLLAGACTDSTVLYNNFVYNRYHPTEFGVAAGRKDFRTVIHGDPFGLGEADFAAATIGVLNRHQPFLQPTRFTTDPGEDASPDHRMVLVFDQPGMPIYQLCREPLPTPPTGLEGDLTLHVSAAFCLHQAELTVVQGKVDGVTGIDDPKFDRLLGQIVLALFPPIDPNDDDRPIFLLGHLVPD